MLSWRATLVLVIAVMLLFLGSETARAQTPHVEPQTQDVPRVIHPDLPTPDQIHEEEHHPYCLWGRADFWIAWMREPRFPALVTVGAITQPRPGALGADGTLVRFGGRQEMHERFGGRFQLGCWLDCEHCLGVEAGFWFLGSRNILFELSSPGAPAIARPFFDVNAGQEDASLVTYPQIASGGVTVTSGTTLYGADAGTSFKINCSEDYPLRFLTGLRYMDLREDLDIRESVAVAAGAPVFAGQTIAVHDHFECDNSFYGINLGLGAGYHVRRLELTATARCGLGMNQNVVRVKGFTNFNGPGGNTVEAGLLALASNTGSRVHETFAVVPQLDLDARFELTRHIYLTAGWTYLYWTNVARVGQQVDTNINPDLVPTSANFGMPTIIRAPRLNITDSDFWVQGVHFGVELRF